MSDSAADDRLMSVESLLAHLQHDFDHLSQVVWRQQTELETLRKELAKLVERQIVGGNTAEVRDPLTESTAVRIRTGGKELSLKSNGITGWQFVTPDTYGDADPGGDTELNTEVFTGVRPLLNYLTTVQAQSTADVIESPTNEEYFSVLIALVPVTL